MEKLKISISPITIEIEAPANFFAENAGRSLAVLANGMLGPFMPQAACEVRQEPEAATPAADKPAATEEAPKPKRTRKAAEPTPEPVESAAQEQPSEEAAPETATETQVSFKDVRAKAIDLQADYFKEIKAKLASFECGRLAELEAKPEHFGEMMTFLNTLENAN